MTDSQVEDPRSTSLANCLPGPDSNSSQEPPVKQRKKNTVERSRVTRACDRCKRKKVRCSGKQPCTLCNRTGQSCDFTAAYSRGRLPSILPETNETIEIGNDFHNADDTSGIDLTAVDLAADGSFKIPFHANEQQAMDIQQRPSSGVSVPFSVINRVDSRVQSSRNSPEPSQTDRQGHYVGPSSGVSFLLRVQKRLHQTVSFSQSSSVFTFGDAPLPKFDPSFFVLPPKADAQKLVARYFEFAIATHRFLHRPTIESWLEQFYDSLGLMEQRDGTGEKTALLFMVFAQAKEYPDPEEPKSLDPSARYFQAAEHQLSSETGEIRLTSIQARLCQCFYLLSQSRVNHCWSLFGTTARLMLALGIHRKRRVETSNGSNLIDLECRKRVFWCAYGLDNYLSAALGRPRTFHDDDIDQELPNCIDDSDLTAQSFKPRSSKSQSIMMASIAHNTLSRIISLILRDLYSIRPPSFVDRVKLSAKYSEDLSDWRGTISYFLDADSFHTSLLIPLFQRQRNVLNLAYYHAIILVHRPFLLSNFAGLKSRKSRSRGALNTTDITRNVESCLDAAMHITTIVNELAEEHQIFPAFWFTHYFAFCAVVVLYVYTIQLHYSPEESYRTYFKAAAKCQEQISSVAENESLLQRYSVVLEELRLEAVKKTQSQPELQNPVIDSSFIPRARERSAGLHGAVGPLQYNLPGSLSQIGTVSMGEQFATGEDAMFNDYQHGETPTSLMAELTGWGEFDSLVTAGMGALEFSFAGNQNLW